MKFRRILKYILILVILILFSAFAKWQLSPISFYHFGNALFIGLILYSIVNYFFIKNEFFIREEVHLGELFQNVLILSSIALLSYQIILFITVHVYPHTIQFYVEADENFRIRYLGGLIGLSPVHIAELLANSGDTDLSDFSIDKFVIEYFTMWIIGIVPYSLIFSSLCLRFKPGS